MLALNYGCQLPEYLFSWMSLPPLSKFWGVEATPLSGKRPRPLLEHTLWAHSLPPFGVCWLLGGGIAQWFPK